MREFSIRLSSVPDVEAFVSISTSRNFTVSVSDGQQTVNGKSFMQMFCLDLTRHLRVFAECDDLGLYYLVEEMHRRISF